MDRVDEQELGVRGEGGAESGARAGVEAEEERFEASFLAVGQLIADADGELLVGDRREQTTILLAGLARRQRQGCRQGEEGDQ